jgi:uncharacterized protein (DUF1499 family)
MSLWMIPSAIVLVLIGVGLLGAYTRVLGPEVGFGMFAAGFVLALVFAIGLAGLGAVGAVFGKAWRGSALRGALVPIAVAGIVLFVQSGVERPPFNDVTTDVKDAPLLPSSPNPTKGYPAAWVEEHEKRYAALGPVESAAPPAETYARALALAREMPSWEIVAEDPEAGTIAVVATSRLFGFKDDVAIRVRASGPGSRMDLRSRSRFGRSDLGANAARIRDFIARFEAKP